MKGNIVLNKPLLINGVNTKELKYDTEKITCDMFVEANGKAVQKGNGITGAAAAIDYSFQLYLGFMSVLAEDSRIDLMDLERITGPDLFKFVSIGRNFTIDAGESPEESSEEPFAIIPASTTPAQPISEE